MAIIPINRLQEENSAGDWRAGTLLNFADFEQRLLLVVKNQLLAVASLQPNGLGRLLTDDIRVGNRFFGHLITVHRNIGEDGPAVRSSGHIIVVAVVDALDFKVGIGNYVAGLAIPHKSLLCLADVRTIILHPFNQVSFLLRFLTE